MAAKLLQMGHVASWSEPQLAPHEAQWYRMWGEALVTGLLWTFGGSHTPGAQGSGRTVTPIWKGSKVEAIHTWCRSRASAPASTWLSPASALQAR